MADKAAEKSVSTLVGLGIHARAVDAQQVGVEFITEQYCPLVDACKMEHGGKHFEPECPICIALKEVCGDA
jgi:hypothetical protein